MRCTLILTSLFVVTALACGSPQATATSSAAQSGPVDLHLAQAFDDGLSQPAALPAMSPVQIVVTLARIDVRTDAVVGGSSWKSDDEDETDVWTTVVVGPRTVDLLSLPTGGFTSLGVTSFPAGGAERLRLFTSASGPSYVTTADGVHHALVVPSGGTRGIVLTGDFDVAPCATGTITLAFTGSRAIVAHPASVSDADGDPDDVFAPGAWVLRPVIRLAEVLASGSCPSSEGTERKGHQ